MIDKARPPQPTHRSDAGSHGQNAMPAAPNIAPDPVPAPHRAVFEDLPAETIANIAAHVFQASVHDQTHTVESLACNADLRSTLADELHAGQVLRAIHACRDLPDLDAALDAVHRVFPPYRHGCLSAALHLFPRLDRSSESPGRSCLPFGELLRTVAPPPGSEAAAIDVQERLLVRWVDGLRQANPQSVSSLEHALALVGNESAPGPALARALLRWTTQLLTVHFFTGMPQETMRQRLMAAAPQALNRQVRSLCEFSRLAEENLPLPQHEVMAAQIAALSAVPAADLASHLQIVGQRWSAWSRVSHACRALHLQMFLRLNTEQQLEFIQQGMSPWAPHEMAPFLRTKIGQAPAATLLRIARRYESNRLAELTRDHEELVCGVVAQSPGQPDLAETLHMAISSRSARDPASAAFIRQHSAHLAPDEQLALGLHLDLVKSGCGESPGSQGGALEAMSRRVDDLLRPGTTAVAPAIGILARISVGWLTTHQRCRLIDRVMELPPASAARLLARMIPRAPYPNTPANVLMLTGRAIAACESLPPEFRAAPLAGLLDMLMPRDTPALGELQANAARIHHALPAALRPPFNPIWRKLRNPA